MHERVFGRVWFIVVLGVAGGTFAGDSNDPKAGVRAQYFRGGVLWGGGDPILERVEQCIDHDWAEGEVVAERSDWVSALWTADLVPPLTGTYRLITTTDDGVRLRLDGRLIIDHWESHEVADDSAEVESIAGRAYLLQMEWYEGTGRAVAQLSWQSEQIPRQVIPAGALQLPVHATRPYPADGAVDASQTFPLRWKQGEATRSHDVYFGQDANAVAAATPADAAIYKGSIPYEKFGNIAFDPGPLEWNKTYYWRVDEINEANPASPWKGSVWRFTTADFLVLDDFESYTDEDVNRIFYTWTGCFGCIDPPPGEEAPVGCDLIVGYRDPPYCEQKIVHSGWQSMPLDYNNVAPPYYGETTRTWDSTHDWTINGVDIPLADISAQGVNLAKIMRMRIGIGDPTDPKPCGAGLLLIDDIRVIKAATK